MHVQYIRNGRATALMIVSILLALGLMIVLLCVWLEYHYSYKIVFGSFSQPCSQYRCNATSCVVKIVNHENWSREYYCSLHANNEVDYAKYWNELNNYPDCLRSKLIIAGGLLLSLLIPALICFIQNTKANRGTDKRERLAKAPHYFAIVGGLMVIILGFVLTCVIFIFELPSVLAVVSSLGGIVLGYGIILSAKQKMANPIQSSIEATRTEPGRVFYDLCIKNGVNNIDSEENLLKAVDIMKYSGKYPEYSATKETARRLFQEGKHSCRTEIDLKAKSTELQQVMDDNRKIRESNLFGKDGSTIIEQIRKQKKPKLIPDSVYLILQTASDTFYYCRTAQQQFVYIRSSDSGTNELPSIRKVGNVNVTGITSHPEEHVFTSATVGGITTGGVHTNPAWTELHYGKTETWHLTAGYGAQATVTAAIINDEDIKYFMYDQALKNMYNNSNTVNINSYLSKQTANRLLEVLNSIAQC